MGYKLTILTFHRVVVDPYFIPPMAIREKVFKRLVKRLKWLGRVIPLFRAVQKINEKTLKGSNFAITFDDGYLDNYRTAARILLELDLPATFFIPFQNIEDQEVFWWDYLFQAVKKDKCRFIDWLISQGISIQVEGQLPDGLYARRIVQIFNGLSEAKRQTLIAGLKNEFGMYEGPGILMNWSEIGDLAVRGFEIGSHTISHIPLTDLDDSKAEDEILRSKKLISGKLNSEVNGFCYPRGAFSDRHKDMVRRCGYSYAVSTRFGSNKAISDLYALNRRTISDFPDFRDRFAGSFHLLELSGAVDPILLKRRIA